MKVITKCVIDMNSLLVVDEISYEYSGPVALCGGSSGGGTSGKVDYPEYMKDWHTLVLDDAGADTLTSSITAVTEAGLGNSPWTTQVAYDPDADVTAMLASATTLQTLVTLLSTGTTLDDLISSVLDETRITDSVDAYAADLAVRLTSEVLPRFEAGMRDINAVTSSAFAVGRAIIEDAHARQVAVYSAGIRIKAFSEDAIRVIGLKLEYQRAATTILAEMYRMKIVAKKEENDIVMKIDEADALWDIELFQHSANMLAAIGSASVSPGGKEPSTFQSMLGGAMTGAAAGALWGSGAGPPGTLAGAGIGALFGAATGLMMQ